MEPTIYKPGAYKSPGIYKGAGGIYNGHGVYNDGAVEFVEIGGKKYPVITINGQKWTKYNIDYKWPGLSVPINYNEVILEATTPQAMYYDFDETEHCFYGDKYGLLYNWYAVNYLNDHKAELLPENWRVPNNSDWNSLISFVGNNSAIKLKSKNYWANNDGLDEFGFCALPAGYFNSSNNTFDSRLVLAQFWTNEATSLVNAYSKYIFENINNVETDNYFKHRQFSLRLVCDV